MQRADFYQRLWSTATPFTLAVVASLLRTDGAILLVQPPADQRTVPSCWELPGGKMITEESLASALVRELKEELGISLSAADLLPL